MVEYSETYHAYVSNLTSETPKQPRQPFPCAFLRFPMSLPSMSHMFPHPAKCKKFPATSAHAKKKSPRTFNAKKSSRNPDANHTVTRLPRNPHPRNDMPNQTIIPQPRIATPRADRVAQVSAPIGPVRSCLLDKNCPAIGAEHQTSNALVSASLFFLITAECTSECTLRVTS
jgi:hypothetical protein